MSNMVGPLSSRICLSVTDHDQLGLVLLLARFGMVIQGSEPKPSHSRHYNSARSISRRGSPRHSEPGSSYNAFATPSMAS